MDLDKVVFVPVAKGGSRSDSVACRNNLDYIIGAKERRRAGQELS
ncbi:hypothetical protein [Microvirga massiliensis]|nr:hypothetical protein [Microvirga massiliensis]